jgi:hypothetical protein
MICWIRLQEQSHRIYIHTYTRPRTTFSGIHELEQDELSERRQQSEAMFQHSSKPSRQTVVDEHKVSSHQRPTLPRRWTPQSTTPLEVLRESVLSKSRNGGWRLGVRRPHDLKNSVLPCLGDGRPTR